MTRASESCIVVIGLSFLIKGSARRGRSAETAAISFAFQSQEDERRLPHKRTKRLGEKVAFKKTITILAAQIKSEK